MPATAGGFIMFCLILFDFRPLRFLGFCATAFFAVFLRYLCGVIKYTFSIFQLKYGQI